MEIRAETPADYAGIAELHARAFADEPTVGLIVSLHRHGARFDPGLSLLAEEGGRLLGHVLLTPATLRLLGADLPGVYLSPLGVDPAAQGRGVGGALVAAGHAAARARGYRLSLLLGHPTYYPRFGYRVEAFGEATLELPVADLAAGEPLEARRPRPDDLPALAALWRHEEAAVDMALEPGPGLLDWISPNPAVACAVWLRGGAVVGYSRIHGGRPERPRVFMAADHDAARGMAGALGATAAALGHASLTLPLHPATASAGAFSTAAAVRSFAPAMACPLEEGAYEPYAAARAAGRPAGRPIWPVAFDLE